MARTRLATVWLGGCSGCHMSFLDLDEFLLELVQKVELVFSPIVDAKEYPRDVDVCLIEGAICNEEHVAMVHKIRERTKMVISFGDCAVTGNVTAIRNQLGLGNRENVLERAYLEAAQLNPCVPGQAGIVPPLLERVLPVHEMIHVDYYLTGCPPPAARIKLFLTQLSSGQTPQLAGADLKFG
jgi:NAD-reducing hydrogenase small subunit